MTKIKLATWNINSVRLRIDLVSQFAKDKNPDIICLQEIKCINDAFPAKAFQEMGYNNLVIRGQKGWHGVAIASKIPLVEITEPDFCQHNHARVAAAQIGNTDIIIHNLYVPAGGDIPNPEENDKFAHKLDFLDRMNNHYSKKSDAKLIVVGDLNIAPYEHDVWSHKALLDVVSHTPIETTSLETLRKNGGLIDISRQKHPIEEKLYSWWSYRSADWTVNNRGRRLDHIWVSEKLLPQTDISSFEIYKDTRSWEKPSDHVPLCVEINI